MYLCLTNQPEKVDVWAKEQGLSGNVFRANGLEFPTEVTDLAMNPDGEYIRDSNPMAPFELVQFAHSLNGHFVCGWITNDLDRAKQVAREFVLAVYTVPLNNLEF